VILTDELADQLHATSVAVLKIVREGYVQVRPDTAGAEIGGGYALFAGEGSPLTQAFGFGFRRFADPVQLEEFYDGKADNWEVTVTPFTSPETLNALAHHGYRPNHFEGELCRTTDDPPDAPRVTIVEVDAADASFMETTWRGWTGNETDTFSPDELVLAMSRLNARRYVAYVDGQPAAAASMYEVLDSVALAGATTRLPYRGRGLQAALLQRRLHDAGPGKLALMGAVPGSASYRNSQRAGFTPLYSTMVWTRR
jgi:hypothetical protein